MKLPRWNSTAPLEHRKTTAQLRQFTPQHVAPKQRFIPTLTSDQVFKAGMSKANAIGQIGSSVANVAFAVAKAKDSGEIDLAKAQYLTAVSSDEAYITSQPHERPVLDESGNPVMNYVTGTPEIERPYETASEDFSKRSDTSAELISNTTLTSERAKKKFALYVAQQNSQSGKRIDKWKMGNMIDRASATHVQAIAESKTHAMVEQRYHNGLANYADPMKAQAARKKAHQRITYTPLNNHLMQLQTNMMGMPPETVSSHLESIYEDWNAVKHTLSADMNKSVLSGLVSADKDYWSRARTDAQDDRLMSDLISYGRADPMQRESMRENIFNSDAYDRYGSKGKSFMVELIKDNEFGKDTAGGIAAVQDVLKENFFGESNTEDSISRLGEVAKKGGISLDSLIEGMSAVQKSHKEGSTDDNKMAVTLFEAATTTVFRSLDAGLMKGSSEIMADAESDLAVMKQNYRAAIRQAEAAGAMPDRMQIAADVLTGMELPPWAVNAQNQPATSLNEVNMEASTLNRAKFYAGDPVELKYKKRDLIVLKERKRQVSRILRGLR